jgi:hypothetical protein
VAKSIDRRASSSADTPDITPANTEEKGPRRILPGARRASEFFGQENMRREVLRGELVNVLGMLEYGRRESTWWRRAWRWLTDQPQVVPFHQRTAEAHDRTIAEAKADLMKEADGIRADLAAKKLELEQQRREQSRDV